ncbi:type III pantothenate kinase [Flammeovirga agarivorans]|uniref:Type III pantothenate kinase n=1 Tax=Flammeovirga agarivorans TaxID=2726742 RepID=A0A7X8XVJ6_9BACT|nr:type III pantothenate kinase [Flammeovirga agarivorans]NLR91324.1 type III pantothenate kinase [Flammeovirga agarivorans]
MNKRVAIDIGNTLIKVGYFKDNELIEVGVYDDDVKLIQALYGFSCEWIGVANVGSNDNNLIQQLKKDFKVLEITSGSHLPFKNVYATPTTLGVDRIAAIAAAQEIYPNSNCLVIDIGTCVTFDFITEGNEYLGGAISPGIDMRLKAMHTFTAKLPMISVEHLDQELVGNSTTNCMLSGAINGLTAEIEGTILRYEKKFGRINTLLCGGVANTFESKLNSSIFADRNLVLKGIDSILRLHVQTN